MNSGLKTLKSLSPRSHILLLAALGKNFQETCMLFQFQDRTSAYIGPARRLELLALPLPPLGSLCQGSGLQLGSLEPEASLMVP